MKLDLAEIKSKMDSFNSEYNLDETEQEIAMLEKRTQLLKEHKKLTQEIEEIETKVKIF